MVNLGPLKPEDVTIPPVQEKPTMAKAIIATTGALGVAITAALADGKVTVWEIVLGVLAAIGTGAATYAVTNKPS